MKLWKYYLSEFLSEYTEVHAFVIGIYCGLTEWKGLDDEAMKNPDVLVEPHYARGGYILGTILRVGIILLIGSQVVSI
jgi:hypothetical protein